MRAHEHDADNRADSGVQKDAEVKAAHLRNVLALCCLLLVLLALGVRAIVVVWLPSLSGSSTISSSLSSLSSPFRLAFL